MSTPFSFDLKWAQTLDGQLCDDDDRSQWITGARELERTHELRRESDAVLVGAATFLKDLCQLTVRRVPLREGERQPVRIIVDGSGRLAKTVGSPKVIEALSRGARPTVLLSPEPLARSIENVHVVAVNLKFDLAPDEFRANLFTALTMAEARLGRSLRKILVEGGSRTLTTFLKNGLCDSLCVSVAPIITGGDRHRIRTLLTLTAPLRFDWSEVQTLSPDVMGRLLPRRTPDAIS